jgi:hypothetical protein
VLLRNSRSSTRPRQVGFVNPANSRRAYTCAQAVVPKTIRSGSELRRFLDTSTNRKTKLIASNCGKLSSKSALALGFLCASHGALQTLNFKPFHRLLEPLHGLTHGQPQAKYASCQPTTTRLQIADEFVFRRGRIGSRDSHPAINRIDSSPSLIFQKRLTRRAPGVAPRCVCDAHVVRTESPFRDTRRQQRTFKSVQPRSTLCSAQ